MNKQYKIVDGVAVSTGISWATHSWNPLRYRVKQQHSFEGRGSGGLASMPIVPVGAVVNYCQKISPGCVHCYAERQGKRKRSPDFNVPNLALVEPFIDEKELREPLGMRRFDRGFNKEKPLPAPHARPAIFVGDMSDLWGDWVPFEMIDRIMAVAALRPEITFMFLTKRTARMVEYFTALPDQGRRDKIHAAMAEFSRTDLNVPYPRWQTESNCLLGFSAENQEYFDSRWADMRKLAAMGWKVFASIEPQIGPVDCSAALALVHGTECTICGLPATARMRHVHRESLSWCVIGGESGHGARPFNIQWMRDSIAQFKAAGVPLWCKQFGANRWNGDRPLIGDYVFGSHGSDWSLWAPDLRVRQLPELRL